LTYLKVLLIFTGGVGGVERPGPKGSLSPFLRCLQIDTHFALDNKALKIFWDGINIAGKAANKNWWCGGCYRLFAFSSPAFESRAMPITQNSELCDSWTETQDLARCARASLLFSVVRWIFAIFAAQILHSETKSKCKFYIVRGENFFKGVHHPKMNSVRKT
jgi:hypothetical protein